MQSNQYGAFVQAIIGGDIDVAKQLLAAGTDINAANDSGWTPLYFAIENMQLESIKFLLENGAHPNQKDWAGMTPLHLAIDVEQDYGTHVYVMTGEQPASAELTALLLEHGADPNAKTTAGKTPLAVAKYHPKAIALLKQHGARDG
jgi:ankyrin repeat protein